MIHIHYNGNNLDFPIWVKIFIGVLMFLLTALVVYGFFVCVL